MTTYRIRDWSKHFENNRTRELKELRFVILPNKQDGDGYTELLDHPNGAAHYGAWCSIVQVASKCEPRGTLIRNVGTIPQGGAVMSQEGARPHDAASLSRLTRIPIAIFAEALPRLVEIGWLETAGAQTQENQPDRTIPQDVGAIPHPPAESRAALKDRTEENRKEEKKELVHAEKPRSPNSKVRLCDDDYLEGLQQNVAYQNLNVRATYGKLVAWCENRGVKPTRGRLLNWLNREDQPLNGVGKQPKAEPEDRAAEESRLAEKMGRTYARA